MVLRDFNRKLFFFFSYFQKPRWDTGISPPELLDFINAHPPGRAIDLGCGTGTNVITLVQHGWQVVGIDFIPKAVRDAKRKIRKAGIEASIKNADVTHFDWSGDSFDLALDIGCYHNLSQSSKRAYESNIIHLLSEGGTLLLYGFLSSDETGYGIFQSDIERLTHILDLERRKDGTDRERASAWFWLKRKPSEHAG